MSGRARAAASNAANARRAVALGLVEEIPLRLFFMGPPFSLDRTADPFYTSRTGSFLLWRRLFVCRKRSCRIPLPESGIESRLTLVPLACLVFCLFKRKMPYDLI